MTRIAYLGTGLLGSALVEAALGRGDQVTVWNRTAAKAQALEPFGARAAATPAEAVQGAERVHLVLNDDAAVEDVIARCRAGLDSDAIIIDHSTTAPDLTADRARRLDGDGIRYLHCPVFMGPAAARQSQGLMLCSGPRAWLERVKDALARQASRLEYLGERPDLAAVYKLSGNAFIVGITALLADVFQIGNGAGVAPADVLRLFDFFNPLAVLSGRARNLAAGDFRPAFALTMARKDLRLMLETAGDRSMMVLPGIADRMDELIADGHGGLDLAVIGRDAVG